MRAFASVIPPALLLCALATSQGPAGDDPPWLQLQLDADIPWLRDPETYVDGRRPKRSADGDVDRDALLAQALARAGEQQRPVLWYVYRIVEKSSGGRQMYRAPVLDLYAQQVLFADPDVAAMVSSRFVPLRMVCDERMSARFGLRPLEFVEPAVVFLKPDGEILHVVERLRTFDALWFASLLRRVLAQGPWSPPAAAGERSAAEWTAVGEWERALEARRAGDGGDVTDQIEVAALLRRLRRPGEAAELLDGLLEGKLSRGQRAQCAAERGLLALMQGDAAAAAPLLFEAQRSDHARTAEARYLLALCRLRLGHEAEAMRLFTSVADRFPDVSWGRRARANVMLGNDDRPVGAAFCNFEHIGYLPEAAYQGLPRDTTWAGDPQQPAVLAARAVEFLLESQRENGGFTDSRYAYWPDSTITPNTWVAITALCATALHQHRGVAPARIDAALAAAERFMFDPSRLNRGSNEDVYADAYRLLYLSDKAMAMPENERGPVLSQLDALLAEACARQFDDGFWAHEYKNAFCTGAMMWSLLLARQAGGKVSDEVLSKGAEALAAARYEDGAFAYGGTARGRPRPSGRKDAAARMPLCESVLLAMQRSEPDKVAAAFRGYFQHMDRIETVRRNDFHSDGELAGFFFFHGLYHTSETNRTLPEPLRRDNAEQLLKILQRIPEFDGSFVDSHEIGRSYGTAMALLTLTNVLAD